MAGRGASLRTARRSGVPLVTRLRLQLRRGQRWQPRGTRRENRRVAASLASGRPERVPGTLSNQAIRVLSKQDGVPGTLLVLPKRYASAPPAGVPLVSRASLAASPWSAVATSGNAPRERRVAASLASGRPERVPGTLSNQAIRVLSKQDGVPGTLSGARTASHASRIRDHRRGRGRCARRREGQERFPARSRARPPRAAQSQSPRPRATVSARASRTTARSGMGTGPASAAAWARRASL